jgi:hypothetical protein
MIHLNQSISAAASSYVVFGGKDVKNINIGTRESLGYYTQLHDNFVRDTSFRSATPVKDINKDGFNDLILGFPADSHCVVYLGRGNGFVDMIPSFTIYGAGNGDNFGWAIASMNDFNEDGFNDIAVSAPNSGTVYIVFCGNGKDDIFVENMNGIKISASSSTYSTGMSISSAGDFNNDGHQDIIVSALMANTQSMIYIIFGNGSHTNTSILLQSDDNSIFKIISPVRSFAGLSLSGLGDINDDGFDDIAIGSVPFQGGYTTQITYVLYGKPNFTTSNLFLSSLKEGEDGFIITGGGFMVSGLGDLNNDGFDDFCVVNFQQWRAQGNAYLLTFPTHMTTPPTFLPSSSPSTEPTSFPSSLPSIQQTTFLPSNLPTVFTLTPTFSDLPSNESFSPTIQRTAQPTRLPTTRVPTRAKITLSPSISPTTKKPTVSPSLRPSAVPTIKPTENTMVPTSVPIGRRRFTPLPTFVPSERGTVAFESNGEQFATVNCQGTGRYLGTNGNNQFVVSGEGTIRITSGTSGMNIYVIYPGKNTIIIKSFRLNYDILDLSGIKYYKQLKDVAYRTDPLTLVLSTEQIVIFPDIFKFDLIEGNFHFATTPPPAVSNNGAQLAVVVGTIFLFVFFMCAADVLFHNKSAESEKDKKEVKMEILPDPESLSVATLEFEKDSLVVSNFIESYDSVSSEAPSDEIHDMFSGSNTIYSNLVENDGDYSNKFASRAADNEYESKESLLS